jgi:hypothetical protein
MEAYRLTKEDVLSSSLVQVDETTHRMLEGDDRKHWRLWGFLNHKGVYFEIHNTRSGTVATSVLSETLCKYLLSDAYCGYGKAIKDINKIRKDKGLPPIECLYCNAHAIRKFKEAKVALKEIVDSELEWFISKYKTIYDMDEVSETLSDEAVLNLRKEMKIIFEEMKKRAEAVKDTYPSGNAIEKALSYFLNYYDGLTLFTTDSFLPIGRVECWRGDRSEPPLSVSTVSSFVPDYGVSSIPFPAPSHQTVQEDFPHTAFIQNIMPSLSTAQPGFLAA